MFIGHIALALAAKRATPRVSLATLLLATQWADVLWPVLLALGLERVRIQPGNTAFTPLDFVSYPYSHSLVALVGWGILFGLVYRAVAGGRNTFWLLAALVVSHWVLDFVTHRPDLPLWPGSGAMAGLGLWNSVPATIAIEGSMFAIGVWIYARSAPSRDRIGTFAFWGLVVFLVALYLANAFGPPPPSVTAIAIAGIVGAALFTVWSWWADRHRG